MTTLQLARLVATAARAVPEPDAAAAVLLALDANGYWLSRSVENPDGLSLDIPMPRVPEDSTGGRGLGMLPFDEITSAG